MSLPADLLALVRAGLLVEVEPGVYRRPRMPSRAEVYAGGRGAPRDREPTGDPRQSSKKTRAATGGSRHDG